MGGDLAPRSNALGAIRAAQELGVEVVLVGRGEAILQCLKENGIDTLPKGVEIANAEDVVDMHDDPAAVVRKRKDSSMVVGLRMLAEGGGDAFISAGGDARCQTHQGHPPRGDGPGHPDKNGRRSRPDRLRRERRMHTGIPAAICVHGLVLRAEDAET